jgi:DNA-binding NtrC family response regulator
MRKKILVVDDNQAMRQTLHRLLEPQGYEIREAANGFAVMEMLSHGAVDLVITDYIMRGMDGIELIEEIQDKWPMIGLVLLTGCLSADAAKRMLRGRAHFLSKPVTLVQLLGIVQQLLS